MVSHLLSGTLTYLAAGAYQFNNERQFSLWIKIIDKLVQMIDTRSGKCRATIKSNIFMRKIDRNIPRYFLPLVDMFVFQTKPRATLHTVWFIRNDSGSKYRIPSPKFFFSPTEFFLNFVFPYLSPPPTILLNIFISEYILPE